MRAALLRPSMRGFIALNAHPDGCAANVSAQLLTAAELRGDTGFRNALIIGSSTGYGLASLLYTAFGLGVDTLGVCVERPASDEKTASAGWYNLAAVHQRAASEGRLLHTVNGDAFTAEVKRSVIDDLRANFGPVDLVIYSLAAPRRRNPLANVTWRSAIKPIGDSFAGKSVDLNSGTVVDVLVSAATETEIEGTLRVMGGDDWADWMNALDAAGLLGDGCRTVAYSYIGSDVMGTNYRSWTIGRAKDHLEMTARQLNIDLRNRVGGGAWAAVLQPAVTQALTAVPAAPLYAALAIQALERRGLNESPVEQVARLFRDHLRRSLMPQTDEEQRIRLDDRELCADVQDDIRAILPLLSIPGFPSGRQYAAAFRRAYEQFFGFSVPGVDYGRVTEIDRPLHVEQRRSRVYV